MRSIGMNKIDSSLAFGFYVRNEQEFAELYEVLAKGNEIFDNWVMGLQNYYFSFNLDFFSNMNDFDNNDENGDFDIIDTGNGSKIEEK